MAVLSLRGPVAFSTRPELFYAHRLAFSTDKLTKLTAFRGRLIEMIETEACLVSRRLRSSVT